MPGAHDPERRTDSAGRWRELRAHSCARCLRRRSQQPMREATERAKFDRLRELVRSGRTAQDLPAIPKLDQRAQDLLQDLLSRARQAASNRAA